MYHAGCVCVKNDGYGFSNDETEALQRSIELF